MTVLVEIGYTVETDRRSNRVELNARGMAAWNWTPCSWRRTAPLGRWPSMGGHVFPRSFFVTGSLAGVLVPCVSVAAQRLFHTGY